MAFFSCKYNENIITLAVKLSWHHVKSSNWEIIEDGVLLYGFCCLILVQHYSTVYTVLDCLVWSKFLNPHSLNSIICNLHMCYISNFLWSNLPKSDIGLTLCKHKIINNERQSDFPATMFFVYVYRNLYPMLSTILSFLWSGYIHDYFNDLVYSTHYGNSEFF